MGLCKEGGSSSSGAPLSHIAYSYVQALIGWVSQYLIKMLTPHLLIGLGRTWGGGRRLVLPPHHLILPPRLRAVAFLKHPRPHLVPIIEEAVREIAHDEEMPLETGRSQVPRSISGGLWRVLEACWTPRVGPRHQA